MRRTQICSWLSVLSMVVIYGCGGQPGGEFKTAQELKKAPDTRPVEKHDDHDHHHEPPHGGTLTMLGDHDGQVELVLEKISGKLTAYLLDGEAEKPLLIEQKEIGLAITQVGGKAAELKVTLAPRNPKEGDGKYSVFVAQVDALKGQEAFVGSYGEIAVGAKKFTQVKLDYRPGHDDHGHDDHAKHDDHEPAKGGDKPAEKKADGKAADHDHDHDHPAAGDKKDAGKAPAAPAAPKAEPKTESKK